MLDRSLIEGEQDDFLFTIVLLLTIQGEDRCSLYRSSIFEFLSKFLHFLSMFSQFQLATKTNFLINSMSLLLSAIWFLSIQHSSLVFWYFSSNSMYRLDRSLQLAQIYFSASSIFTRALRIQSVPVFSYQNWVVRALYLLQPMAILFFKSEICLASFSKYLSCSDVTPSLLISLMRISDYQTSSVLLAELCEFSLSASDDSGSLALYITLSRSESNENFLRSCEVCGFFCRSCMKSLISVFRLWFQVLTDMLQLLLLKVTKIEPSGPIFKLRPISYFLASTFSLQLANQKQQSALQT